jgi:ribonuclease P protein component
MVLFSLRELDAQLGESELRIAVVASRKVGDAVRRNRAKRLLREALRAHGADLKRPQWLVIVARQSLSDPSVKCEQVRAELGELLTRLDATTCAAHASPRAGA